MTTGRRTPAAPKQGRTRKAFAAGASIAQKISGPLSNVAGFDRPWSRQPQAGRSDMSATATIERCAEPSARPQVRGGVVAYLGVDGAAKAAEFYKRAFGAEEVARQPVDAQGRTMHIHLYINGGSLMLSDPYPEHGYPLETPGAFTLHLQVDDVDAWWRRAVDAGAEITLPLQEMFWGDRYGQLRDPFGVNWSLAAPVKD
jgi:PhnB protein